MGHSVNKSKRPSLHRPIVLRLLSGVALIPHVLTITLQMERSAMAGSCTVGAVSVCSGPASGADTTQLYDYNGPIDITTSQGFGLSVTGDYGMDISGVGGVSFIDDYGSAIASDDFFGVYVENDIGGDINFVSTGSIVSTGTNGDGIRTDNFGDDTVLRLHDVTGDFNGVNVNHNGTGSIYVASTGTLTGHKANGISVYGNSGTSLTIEAVDTQGVVQGIWGSNRTTGALNITSSGLAVGSNGDGIRADNYGTDVTVTAADTHGGNLGIIAQHYGTGALQIDSTGTAIGDSNAGIYAYAGTASTNATINAVDTQGGTTGIDVRYSGIGSVAIASTGTAIGGSSQGIAVRTGSASKALTITVHNAQGGNHGIKAIHESAVGTPGNAATITVTGHIRGGSGYGISTETLAGVLTNINVEAGSVVESTDGNGVYNGIGDSDVTVADGATVNGRIDLGLGSDTLTLRGGLSGTTVLDGGGGGTDVLTVSNAADETRVAGDIRNWNVINLDDSTLTLTGGNMTVGTAGDMATGIFLRSGSILDGSQDKFSLAGNLSLAAGTRFLASGNGGGTSSINGNVVNAGTISAVGAGAGDTVRIAGDYTGNNGTIALETALGGDMSATDRLDIQGDTSGTSVLSVVNVGGAGAATSEGIELITVGGVSNGTFTLKGDYEISGVPVVVAGAYSYRLFKGNRTGTETDNWYLRSQLTNPTDPVDPLYQPGVPVYEAYPQALLGLNNLSTLQQRAGNRFWLAGGNPEPGDLSSALLATSGIWARIEGAHSEIHPRFATAGTAFDQSAFRAQAGMDAAFHESVAGTLIASISTHYTHGETDADSMHGVGQISTDGYGAGGALTWYGSDGTYFDGQAQATWYESDLRSLTANRFLVRGNDAFGYAFSLEGGKRIGVDDGWSMTPQAQIVYSRIDFDRFSDALGASVSLDRGASLQGRLGLTLDWEAAWQAGGRTSRAHAYGIANIYREFLNGTRVDVAGEKFRFQQDRVWGGLGVGGSFSWNDDMYSVYAEGLVNTSFAHIGDSYSLQGKIGLKAKW